MSGVNPVEEALNLYTDALPRINEPETKKSFLKKWFTRKPKTVTFADTVGSNTSKYSGKQIAIIVLFVIIIVGIIAGIIAGIVINEYPPEILAPEPVAVSTTATTRIVRAQSTPVTVQTISLPATTTLPYYIPFARRAAFMLYPLPETLIAVDSLTLDFTQDMPVTNPVELILSFDNDEREARGRDTAMRTTTYKGVLFSRPVIHIRIANDVITATVANNVGCAQDINSIELPLNTDCAGVQVTLNIGDGNITLGASFLGTAQDQQTDASYIDSLENDFITSVTDYQEEATALTAWKPDYYHAAINSVYFNDTNVSKRDMSLFNLNISSTYKPTPNQSVVIGYGGADKYTKGVESEAMFKGALVEANLYPNLPLVDNGLIMIDNDALLVRLSSPMVPNSELDTLTLTIQGGMLNGPFDLAVFNMSGTVPNLSNDLPVATLSFKAQGKMYVVNPTLQDEPLEDEVDLAPIMSYSLANTYKYVLELPKQTVTYFKGTDKAIKATGTLSNGILAPFHYFILRAGTSTTPLTGYIRQISLEKTVPK